MLSPAWPAPAKLNLFLHITGRRDDGYHLLQTVFQFIQLQDEIDFTVLANDAGFRDILVAASYFRSELVHRHLVTRLEMVSFESHFLLGPCVCLSGFRGSSMNLGHHTGRTFNRITLMSVDGQRCCNVVAHEVPNSVHVTVTWTIVPEQKLLCLLRCVVIRLK